MPNYPQPATTTANKDSTTYPLTSPRGKSSLMGRLFTLATIGEAATWGGLLIGMFLKYVTETTALGVMSRDVVLAPARNDTVPIQEVSVQTACH